MKYPLMYYTSYDQHITSLMYPRFTFKKTKVSTACGVNAAAQAISHLRGIPYFPCNIIDLMDNVNGFGMDEDGYRTIINWYAFEKIWHDIEVEPILWDRKKKTHLPIEKMKFPAIISVDGDRIMDGYQTHFMFAWGFTYSLGEIVNVKVFNPWSNENMQLLPKFGDDIETAIYSYIKFKKK